MGFGHQSSFKGALIVKPGTQQTLPIPTAEASELEIGWTAEEGEQDIEFSASFTGGESNEVVELVPATRGAEKQDDIKLQIEQAGSCILLFKNCSGGFFGGTTRKVTYTATMQTKQEIAANAEKERLEQEKAAADEQYKKARDEEHVRRQAADQKLAAFKKSVDGKQHQASELLGSAGHKQAEAEILRKRLEDLEKSLKEDMEKSGSLALEAAAENAEATSLRQESFKIARGFPVTLQVSLVKAAGLKHLNFTGDNPWCQCSVKDHYHTDSEEKTVAMCQTKAIPSTLEPHWDETHELEWRVGDCLEFHVFDKGTLASKEEGKGIDLASTRFYPQGFEGDLPIDGLEDATLHVRIVPVIDKLLPAVHEPHWPITLAQWSVSQVHDLGKDPAAFKGKAELISGYVSPSEAVKALNAASVDIPKSVFDHGYCVILHWDKQVQTHVLMYRSDSFEAVAQRDRKSVV